MAINLCFPGENLKLTKKLMSRPFTTVHRMKFLRLRNYQAEQQAVLIGLLNQQCDITLVKPFKKSVVSKQFQWIESIEFSNGDTVELDKLIENRCNMLRSNDLNEGVMKKTAKRRYENNKYVESLHYLRDMLLELGYFFNTVYSVGEHGRITTETIDEIFKDGKLLMDKKSIEDKGNRIITICENLRDNLKEVKLEKGNQLVQSVLFDSSEVQ